MSQDLREYDLMELDNAGSEARRLSVTATVGPNADSGNPRGVQITLEAPNGVAYGRVSEAQVRDLIRVLESRISEDSGFTATGIEADRLEVDPDGNVESTYL